MENGMNNKVDVACHELKNESLQTKTKKMTFMQFTQLLFIIQYTINKNCK